MADIVDPFDQQQSGGSSIVDPFDTSSKSSAPDEAADHGLSERQKLSPTGKALSPFTEYPKNLTNMAKQAQGQIAEGWNQMTHPGSLTTLEGTGLSDIGTGAAKFAMGNVANAFAPASAAYRSIVGQPIEDTTGIPREYSEFAAQLATPGLGLARLGEAKPFIGPPPSTAAEAASARLGVPISRAAVSDSPTVQSASGALKEVPFVGTPLVNSAKTTLKGLDKAAQDTAAAYGSGDTVTAGEAAKSGVEDWITGKSGDIANRVYNRVDNMVDPAFERPLSTTADTVEKITARRANANISGTSPAVAEVQNAIASPGMNYQGLKDLRSHIGNMTPQEMVSKGINPAEAKQIYGSLTTDLRGHVLDAGGPDVLDAFDRANGIYSQIVERRQALSKIIGVKADAPPERVLDRMMQLASSKGGADQATLMQARRAIGPEKWNEVTSAAIARMGRAAPEADFSGDRFVTAWNNMSDRGRRTLFNSTGKPELAQNVQDIMTLSKNYKQLAAMGNPSGTGRVNAIMSALGALGGAVAGTATIGLTAPISMLASVLGGRGIATALSNPVTARSAAQWSKAYVNAVKSGGSPASVTALAPATQRLADSIRKLVPNAQGSIPAAANQDQQQQKRGGRIKRRAFDDGGEVGGGDPGGGDPGGGDPGSGGDVGPGPGSFAGQGGDYGNPGIEAGPANGIGIGADTNANPGIEAANTAVSSGGMFGGLGFEPMGWGSGSFDTSGTSPDPGLGPMGGWGDSQAGLTTGAFTPPAGPTFGGDFAAPGSNSSLASGLAALDAGGLGLSVPAGYSALMTESIAPGLVNVDNIAQPGEDLGGQDVANTNPSTGNVSQGEYAAGLAALAAGLQGQNSSVATSSSTGGVTQGEYASALGALSAGLNAQAANASPNVATGSPNVADIGTGTSPYAGGSNPAVAAATSGGASSYAGTSAPNVGGFTGNTGNTGNTALSDAAAALTSIGAGPETIGAEQFAKMVNLMAQLSSYAKRGGRIR